MNWEELGFKNYRFEPQVTVVNGERIEVKYDSGKPYRYEVVGSDGKVRQSGEVLSLQ